MATRVALDPGTQGQGTRTQGLCGGATAARPRLGVKRAPAGPYGGRVDLGRLRIRASPVGSVGRDSGGRTCSPGLCSVPPGLGPSLPGGCTPSVCRPEEGRLPWDLRGLGSVPFPWFCVSIPCCALCPASRVVKGDSICRRPAPPPQVHPAAGDPMTRTTKGPDCSLPGVSCGQQAAQAPGVAPGHTQGCHHPALVGGGAFSAFKRRSCLQQ